MGARQALSGVLRSALVGRRQLAVRRRRRPLAPRTPSASGAEARPALTPSPPSLFPPPPCLQVAVQLPMFNERAVCQAIIDCCAELEWPAQRLKIQVRLQAVVWEEQLPAVPTSSLGRQRLPPTILARSPAKCTPLLPLLSAPRTHPSPFQRIPAGAGRLDGRGDAGASRREGGWVGELETRYVWWVAVALARRTAVPGPVPTLLHPCLPLAWCRCWSGGSVV